MKKIVSNWPSNIYGIYDESRLLGIGCERCGDPNPKRYRVFESEILICKDCLSELKEELAS